MSVTFRRELRDRLPVPLAQLYSRAHNSADSRSRHNNAFYLFEASVKLAAAPAIAVYLHEVEHGAQRVTALDRLLLQLALPSLGQWVGMLRELAQFFGERPDHVAHPLGHLWQQLSARRRDLPDTRALFQRIKNGPDGQPAGDESCSLLQLFDALVQYRNGVFGHGAERIESFYKQEMEPLLFGAVNEVLAETVFDLLGPAGSQLVYLTELRTVAEDRVEVGLRELVGLQGERMAPLTLSLADSQGLLPNRVAVCWPGHATPLRLDPLLQFRESETAEEVLFLNRDRNKQVEYLSYTTGRTERDRAMAPALAALLSRVTGKVVTEEQLQALGEQSLAETPSFESLLDKPAPPPAVLGDYEILAELGRGGMGVVYLARQLSLGRLVALKTLPADLAGDATAHTRLRREIRALARCDHPNIVKVLTSGELPDGQLYYTMEYIPGCDLEHVWRELSGAEKVTTAARLDSSTWMRAVHSASRKQREETINHARERTKPHSTAITNAPPATGQPERSSRGSSLPPLPELPELPNDPGGFVRWVAQRIRDAASALQTVHDQGLIHRDIKPANLMVTADSCRIVLMDFGLAKGLTKTAQISKGAGFLGTLRYAAPEQLAAATLTVGPPADVRALGVILWEFLTRRRLFGEAADEAQLASLVHDEDVPLLRQLDPSLDRDLEAIVARSTERSVASRLGSAGLLAQYLQLFLDGQPLPIRTPGTGELLGRWVRRHKVLVAAVTVPLLILLTVGGAFWVVRDARARQDAAQRHADEQGQVAAEMTQLRDDAVNEREAKEVQRKLAMQNEQEAQKQKERAERLQYSADMALAQQMFQENQPFRLLDLLRRYEKDEHLKGFEWNYLWRLCQAKLVFGPRHQNGALAVAFSPDGRRAVSGGRDGAVRLWDAATGRELVTLAGHHREVKAVAFRPDGKAVASACDDKTVTVWDSSTGQQLYTVAEASGWYNSVAFSPDGRLLAVSGKNRSIILCDALTGMQQMCWTAHAEDVLEVAFSPDGKLLASASKDKTVKLWDVASGKLVRTLEGHSELVMTVAFNPDGKSLASSDSSYTIIVWDQATGKQIRKLTDHPGTLFGLSFSPDGRQLMSTCSDGKAYISEVGTEKPAMALYGPGGMMWGGAYSPDGTRLALCIDDGSVVVWDLTVADDALTLGFGNSIRNSGFLAQSPDGRWLALGMDIGTIALWDPLAGRTMRTFKGHTGQIMSMAFSQDGRWLVSGSKDKVAKVWQVEDGSELREFRGHNSGITRLAYDPRGRFVASGDWNGIIKVWDPRSGSELASLEQHKGDAVMGLAFSPDSRRLVSAGRDKRVRLWDTASWEVVRTWTTPMELTDAAYCADNCRVAASLLNGVILVYDKGHDDALFTLRGHNGGVYSVAFSPDGRRLVSGGGDQTVRFWELETGRPLMTLRGGLGLMIVSLVFSPDGRRLTARDANGILSWFADGAPGVTETVPKHRLIWYSLQAHDCEKAKQWLATIFYYSRLLEADPTREVDYRRSRAWAAQQQRDYRTALADLTRVLELTKAIRSDYQVRGLAYFGLSQYDKAEADLTQALEIDPKSSEVLSHRGETRARQGRWADAIDDYTRALKLDNKDIIDWLLRGEAQAELGQWGAAVADFNEASERSPTWLRAMSNLAVAQLARGGLPAYRRACVSMFERLNYSDQPSTWNTLSWNCSLAANDSIEPTRLVRLMDRAVATDPKYYAFLNTRGAALYRAARYKDALDQLNEAVAVQGKGGGFEDWVFLAMTEFRLDHADQASANLKRAIALYDEGRKPPAPGRLPMTWSARVEWQQLRKEAEELIQGNKP